MVGSRCPGKRARHFKKIQRADTKYALQEIASAIQTDLDKRHLSYDEALMLGNMIQIGPTRSQAMALCTPSQTETPTVAPSSSTCETLSSPGLEQLLLWEERRRLGISDSEHDALLQQLLAQWKRQGKSVTIDRFPNRTEGVPTLSKAVLPVSLVLVMLMASLTPLAVADQGRSTPRFLGHVLHAR